MEGYSGAPYSTYFSPSPEAQGKDQPILVIEFKVMQIDIGSKGRAPSETVKMKFENQLKRQMEKSSRSPLTKRPVMYSQDLLQRRLGFFRLGDVLSMNLWPGHVCFPCLGLDLAGLRRFG